MNSPLSSLGLAHPVLTAPMAGGPTTPGLVTAAAAAGFISEFGPIAPLGYPAVHHLTSPLRQAATAAGDPELVNLWAGAGYRRAASGPAAGILQELASAG